MSKIRIAILVVLGVIVVGALLRYVVFKEKIDAWGDGLERVGAWQEQYRQEHPGATQEEVDAAFNASINDMKVWKERYKREHPGATDQDADAAFEAAWRSN